MSTHERRLPLVSTRIAAVAVLAVTLLAAASSVAAASPGPSLRYRVVDLGTLGGPNSAETQEFPYVNNAGLVVGFADTATPDPDNGEGFVFHAFGWRGGPMHDLGTLPGGRNSFAIWSNTAGAVVGLSETGRTDPVLGVPENHATLWRHGQVVDLGTLGGHESLAGFINQRGQVVGVAADTVPDQFSLFGWGTRTRAFLWQHGAMTWVPSAARTPALPSSTSVARWPGPRTPARHRTRTRGRRPSIRSSGTKAGWWIWAPSEARSASRMPSTTGARSSASPVCRATRRSTPSAGGRGGCRTSAPSVAPSAPPHG